MDRSITGRTRPIMYATDFSPASRRAFRAALELARARRTVLMIVHVLSPIVQPLIGDMSYISPETWNALETGARRSAQKHLDRLVSTAASAGVRAKSLIIQGDQTAMRLVRCAKGQRVAVLVVGTHGRSGLTRALLGSVAARVVATASCPVLTVRAR